MTHAHPQFFLGGDGGWLWGYVLLTFDFKNCYKNHIQISWAST